MDNGQVLKKNKKGTEYIENANGEVIEKRCSICREMKEIEQFHAIKTGLAGKVSYCKKCGDEKRIAYREKKKEERTEKLLSQDVPIGLKVVDFSIKGRRMYEDSKGNILLDCTSCNEPVPIDGFYTTKGGKQSICIQCNLNHSKQYYKQNKERAYENCKKWRANNRERVNEAQRLRTSKAK